MRELFRMDRQNYNPDGNVYRRPSARAIILKDGKVLLNHVAKYDCYEFPGGGIEAVHHVMSKNQSGQRTDILILCLLGQFPQMAMTPFIDELKMAASLFGGETGLTLDDLGFVQANPSSAEAIKASHETLRLMARKAQRTYASAFANIGFVAASVRDEMPYNRSIVTGMRARWEPIFEPDASAMSVVGDGVIKINQAVPNYFTKDNLRELTGIEAEDNEPVSVEEAEEELIE